MDTSVKKFNQYGPSEDSFIYYDLGNQVFYSAKQGMNYSAIAAPIAIYSLQRLSKLLNQTFEMSPPFNLIFFILMSLFLVFGTILLAKSTRRNMKTDRFRKSGSQKPISKHLGENLGVDSSWLHFCFNNDFFSLSLSGCF